MKGHRASDCYKKHPEKRPNNNDNSNNNANSNTQRNTNIKRYNPFKNMNSQSEVNTATLQTQSNPQEEERHVQFAQNQNSERPQSTALALKQLHKMYQTTRCPRRK